MKIPTNEAPASAGADWSDVRELQQRLAETSERISAMASDVGLAKHVVEYDGDRRKRALARQAAAALRGGDSAAKAELEARASEGYAKELAQLGKEHAAALQVIAEWEAAKVAWDTARSLLAMTRETVRQV